MQITSTIKAGTKLSARSIGDSDCIYLIEVKERKGPWATIKDTTGNVRRVKVRVNDDGVEYLKPDNYSFAPIYRATSKSI